MKSKLAVSMAALSLTFTPLVVDACRPAANWKYPTLKENFDRSQSVFIATIKKVSPSDKGPKLDLQIEFVFKGPIGKTTTVTANEGSSCERIVYDFATDQGCLFFQLADGKLLTNMLDGDSSFCIPKNSPRFAGLIAEYAAKFNAEKSAPKKRSSP